MSDSSRPVAIVTGASRGIGLGIAQALVARGDRVCVTARGADTLAEVVASLGGPEHAIGVAGKAHDPVHQDAAVTATLEAFGRIDMLVNNAGINPVYGPLVELDLDAGRKILEVNLLAALAWTQRVHKAWLGEHGGAIVNVSSLAGARPAHGIGFYGVSKAALTHLTAQLASELGPRVRVNAVAPAVVKTVFATALYEGREEEVAAAYPMARLGVPEDVAGAVAFLLSEQASWITGQTLLIDGGVSLSGGLG
ncbi:SDR family oxidoreductase [Embleya sp. NPDC050493]|uniref:SDR family oxidoreductase n=1 Tax=Embleya sp. NPDC050493 TaxID=3363989 RepID=UPI0037945BE4